MIELLKLRNLSEEVEKKDGPHGDPERKIRTSTLEPQFSFCRLHVASLSMISHPCVQKEPARIVFALENLASLGHWIASPKRDNRYHVRTKPISRRSQAIAGPLRLAVDNSRRVDCKLKLGDLEPGTGCFFSAINRAAFASWRL